MVKQILEMNEKLAKQIVKLTGASCNLNKWIRIHDEPRTTYTFYGATMKTVLEAKKILKLGTLKKEFNEGTKSLNGKNFKFYHVANCEIIGYTEEKIPAQTKKIPVWKCK